MVTGLILLGVSAALSAALYWWLRRRDGYERALVALYPLAFYVTGYLICGGFQRVVHSNWDAARLSFAFAFRNGYQLYYLPGEGPLLPAIYGPFFSFVYLPATLFSRPAAALIAGNLISIILTVGPAKLEFARVLGRRTLLLMPAAAFAFFFVAYMHTSLVAGMTFILAEAPALGFAAAALYFLNRHLQCPCRGSMILSALFVCFSVLTKQTYLPLLVALPVIALARGGWRRALALCAAIFGCLAVNFIVLSFVLDWKAMWFSTVTVPSRHAWIGGFGWPDWVGTFVRPPMPQIGPDEADWTRRIRVLSDSFQALFERSAALIGAGLLIIFTARREGLILRRSAAFSWLAAALFLLPSSIAGPVKLGGAYNAQAPFLYMWLMAVFVIILEFIASDNARDSSSRKIGEAALLCALLTGLVFFLPRNADMLRQFDLSQLNLNAQEEIYVYEKAHPGKVYFPENPLPVLMGSGKLYHFYNGVEERNIAGFAVTAEDFAAHVPPNATHIAWSFGEGVTRGYMPNTEPVEMIELPNFRVERLVRHAE